VGDSDTAGVLDRIYRDEIGHVAYGLKWLPPLEKSRPEATGEGVLPAIEVPPLAQRAKGLKLNVEGGARPGSTRRSSPS